MGSELACGLFFHFWIYSPLFRSTESACDLFSDFLDFYSPLFYQNTFSRERSNQEKVLTLSGLLLGLSRLNTVHATSPWSICALSESNRFCLANLLSYLGTTKLRTTKHLLEEPLPKMSGRTLHLYYTRDPGHGTKFDSRFRELECSLSRHKVPCLPTLVTTLLGVPIFTSYQ